MAQRITEKQLQAMVDYLNKLSGFTPDAKLWNRGDDNLNHATIGMYCIHHAYGGVSLHRIVTDGGGVSDVFNRGHVTKREFYDMMCAYIRGIESVKFGY